MKRVKHEDVTGEKAVWPAPVRPPAAGEAEVIGRPKTMEEQMDAAAGKAAWGVVACICVAIYLLVTLAIGVLRGLPIEAGLGSVILAGMFGGCAWFMTRRSKTAAVIALVLMSFLGLGVIASMFFMAATGFIKLILIGIALAATGNAVPAIFAYHRLTEAVRSEENSKEHIKDVFGDGKVPAEEGA